MPEVIGKISVVKYLTNELGILPEIADDMCTEHANLIEKGVQYRSYDYAIAHEIMKAECVRRGVDMLPDDCFADTADEEDDDYEDDGDDLDDDDWDDDDYEEEDSDDE